MKKQDLLCEIGTEELPATLIETVVQALATQIEMGLKKVALQYGAIQLFATPRRLGVLISQVDCFQKSVSVEKWGPAFAIAYDAAGHPTPACLGFAKACNTTVDCLQITETDKGRWISFMQAGVDKPTFDLLPQLIKQAVQHLPMQKPMRWSNIKAEFIRPVHWIVLLFGQEVIELNLFGIQSGRNTFGHRFHYPRAISIPHPNKYLHLLEEIGHVIPHFTTRKNAIVRDIKKIVSQKGQVVLDESLLNEVTGLVEWPQVLLGEFDARFLTLPKEIILTVIRYHQKYFPVFDEKNRLLPYFVIVSNIHSHHPTQVIKGNQRVIHARLSDAQFFYLTDLKYRLDHRLGDLKKVIFHERSGTLFDKSQRLAALTQYLVTQSHMKIDNQIAYRAGLLSKTDLLTNMVDAFGELQGVMGYYYALHDKEPVEIAHALREQYQPRFSKDTLPETPLGMLLAIADKIDSLVCFSHALPKGDKDPYALRRAALGVLRIFIEKQLSFSLVKIIDYAMSRYLTSEKEAPIENRNTIKLRKDVRALRREVRGWEEIFLEKMGDGFSRSDSEKSAEELINKVKAEMQQKGLPDSEVSEYLKKEETNISLHILEAQTSHHLLLFMEDRLRAQYIEKGFDPAIFSAVIACTQFDQILDLHQRMVTLQDFLASPVAAALISANKRVRSLLDKKGCIPVSLKSEQITVNPLLLIEPAEKELMATVEKTTMVVQSLYITASYSALLNELANLQTPINYFFDTVQVMADDLMLRENRLALLIKVAHLFSTIADFSYFISRHENV